jgi:hypothetical protein
VAKSSISDDNGRNVGYHLGNNHFMERERTSERPTFFQ